MQKITLYRYVRPDGGITVSPTKPDGEYTELFRLVAEDGMTLTDGEKKAACIDTYTPDIWNEIFATESTEEHHEATAEDYQNALRELGVDV